MDQDEQRLNPQENQDNSQEQFLSFMVDRINAGDNKEEITKKLIEAGITEENAQSLIETNYEALIQVALDQKFTANSLFPAILGGTIAAIIGGIIWGWIVILTDYEIGYMAVGIGALCGYAVLLFSKGKRGIPLQITAVLTSLLGLVIGKYYFFYHFLKIGLTEELGKQIADSVSFFSSEVVSFFSENLGLVFDGLDILWIVLAFVAAWRIPKTLGIKSSKIKI